MDERPACGFDEIAGGSDVAQVRAVGMASRDDRGKTGQLEVQAEMLLLLWECDAGGDDTPLARTALKPPTLMHIVIGRHPSCPERT